MCDRCAMIRANDYVDNREADEAVAAEFLRKL